MRRPNARESELSFDGTFVGSDWVQWSIRLIRSIATTVLDCAGRYRISMCASTMRNLWSSVGRRAQVRRSTTATLWLRVDHVRLIVSHCVLCIDLVAGSTISRCDTFHSRMNSRRSVAGLQLAREVSSSSHTIKMLELVCSCVCSWGECQLTHDEQDTLQPTTRTLMSSSRVYVS